MLISLIVTLIVMGLVWWLVQLLPLPHPIGAIVQVLFIILAIVVVLSAFGILPGIALPHIKL